MEGPIHVSVVLCTYNRADRLGKTLESVASQHYPQSLSWELLVVDNNSSDETPQVIEDFRLRYPERVRYLFEPQQGISNARNAGVKNAKGKVVAFIDDDETADVQWLQNLTANLFSVDWVGAGGRVKPLWNGPRPRWMQSESSFIAGPLAMFGPDSNVVALNEPPFGANMAFKKSVFEQLGGFRTDLGRVGKGMLSGEDTEFGRRVLTAGLRVRYEPNAITYHPVEESRLRRRYFLRWWYHKGRTDVREFAGESRVKGLFPVLLGILYDASVEAVRWVFTLDPAAKFICVLKIWTYAGHASEHYRQSSSAKRKGPLRNSNACP